MKKEETYCPQSVLDKEGERGMGGLNCKVRHFAALVLSVAVTSFIFSMYNQKQPHSLKDIVKQTHKQFESLKENLQVGVGGSGTSGEKHLEVDDKYLNLLGFSHDPFYAETTQAARQGLGNLDLSCNNGTAVIVTAVVRGQLVQLDEFISNVQTALPTNPVVVWNVEPDTPAEETDDFSQSLKQSCNSSSCLVKRFNFEDYPDHVKDLSFRAYRPLILQIMLDVSRGCSLWLDIDRRFTAHTKLNLNRLVELAKTGGGGLVGWPSGHPTSSLTHPKMFSFFETTAENFFFHRMIDPSQLLLCKEDKLLLGVMKPWIACCLKKECVAPFGAQSSGCRFDKKPLYRYSGCHAYDAAALNLALGFAFPIQQPYISRTSLTKPVQLLLENSTASL